MPLKNLAKVKRANYLRLTALIICTASIASLVPFAQAKTFNAKHSQASDNSTPPPRVIIGELGQVRKQCGIHVSMDDKSATYWMAKPNQYLVLSHTDKDSWWGVLLQNGTIGYIPSYAVNKLPYLVTRTAGMKFNTEMPSMVDYNTTSRSSDGSDLSEREEVARYALNFIGTPYVWGGNSLKDGVDCSGFVKKLFGTIGVDLPRTAAEQALVGKPITRLEDLEPGDRLYFWEAKRDKIGHTGIYIGNGYFVHSSMGHHGVATDYLTASWRKLLVAARR